MQQLALHRRHAHCPPSVLSRCRRPACLCHSPALVGQGRTLLTTVTDDEDLPEACTSPAASPATVSVAGYGASPSTTPGLPAEDDPEASYTPPNLDDGASVGTLERLGGGSATSTSGSEGPDLDAHAGAGGRPRIPEPVPVSASPRKLQPRAALPPRKAVGGPPAAATGTGRSRPAMRGRAVGKPGANAGVVI